MIGVEQTPDDAEDGVPELMFVHGGGSLFPLPFFLPFSFLSLFLELCGALCVWKDANEVNAGHTARPTDFSWAPGDEETWTATSTSEDNIVMVWQPTMRIWAADDVVVDEKELEGGDMEGVESTVGGGS